MQLDRTGVNGARVTWRDDSAPHQIRLMFQPDSRTGVQQIAVSCTCLATHTRGHSYRPLAARSRWDDPGELLAIWKRHMDE